MERLTLVAPTFLQPPASRRRRIRPLTAAYLRTAGPRTLSRELLGTPDHAPHLTTITADLRRPGTARLLATGPRREVREDLRRRLATFPGRVHIIVGEKDPLEVASAELTVTVIPGAGHFPQLTHPRQLLAALTD